MYRIYCSTIEKLYWGRQYLTADFFDLIRKTFKRNMVFIGAYSGRELIAGAVNLAKANVMYGRYWGCFRDVPLPALQRLLLRGHRALDPARHPALRARRRRRIQMAARLRPRTHAQHPLCFESGSEARDCGIFETRASRSRAMDRGGQGAQPTETATPIGSGIRIVRVYAISRRFVGGGGNSNSGAGSPVRFVTRLRYRVRCPLATSNASCAFDSDLPSASN